MNAGRRGTFLALAGCLAWLSAGCARRGEKVATLGEAEGTVESNDGGQSWKAAGPGVFFLVGDTVRTQARSRARLVLVNGSAIRMRENTRIRFSRGALPSGPKTDLNVELGSAEVEAATEELGLVTALGPARVARGTRIRVSSDGQRSTLEVVVGRAVLLGAAGEMTVDEGHGARMKPGENTLERYDVVVGAPIVEPAAPAPAAPIAAAATPDAGATPPAAPPPPADERPARGQDTRADVTLDAGDSGTLHVAGRSLALRLAFDRLCDGDATVEVKGGHDARTTAGDGSAVLKLHPGTVRYALRCAGDSRSSKPRAGGSLTIKRDSGDAPVSRRAPVNVLDADGRRYTVLFQTRVPALTLKWAGAPAGAAANMSLHIESPDGAKELPSSGPSKQLAAGALGEGSYTWWYSTADGRTSPKTTVTIRFDNAAPTAQFFARRSGAATAPKGLVAIDGVTIDGAKVSAGGHSLAVDDRGRFRAEVAPLNGDDAVIVRLETPRTGVHYYVRRAVSSRHHGRLAHPH
jgi:hypothetical protein